MQMRDVLYNVCNNQSQDRDHSEHENVANYNLAGRLVSNISLLNNLRQSCENDECQAHTNFAKKYKNINSRENKELKLVRLACVLKLHEVDEEKDDQFKR